MTIPNALAFARNYQIPNTKLSPPLLLHCAPQAFSRLVESRVAMEWYTHIPMTLGGIQFIC